MKTTLEQWRMLKAVVDHGGYAQASDAIFKSQSTISYGVHKLQEQLGVTLLEVEGRKAILTEHGRMLLQRAEQLLQQADDLDRIAGQLQQGVEPIVRLALDMIYPYTHLFCVLSHFSSQFPDTRVEIEEFAISGGNEMLENDEVDLLITPTRPVGRESIHVHRERFIPVSSPGHPLQALTSLSYDDLTAHRQVVIRDSSKKNRRDTGWLGAYQRWTVSHFNTSLNIVRQGLAFAWLPESLIQEDLASGQLCELNPGPNAVRYEDLYMIQAHPKSGGPAVRALAELFSRSASDSSHPLN